MSLRIYKPASFPRIIIIFFKQDHVNATLCLKNASSYTQLNRLMKTFLLIIACLYLTGCASSKFTTVINNKTPYPYGKIMVLTIESNNDFYQLDSSSYSNTIQRSFNKIDNFDFRKQLERTVDKNLSSQNTSILKSSDFFQPNSETSYHDFLKALKESDAEAVLILNLKNYWNSNSYTINNNVISENQKPNALFIGYLVDLKDNKVVWAAKAVINAITIAGYDTLNSKLANKLGDNLSRGNYLYPKQ